MDSKELLLRVAAGIGLIVIAAYLGITRDKTQKRKQRVNFLCSLIFIWIAVLIAGYAVVSIVSRSVTLTAENYQSVSLTFEILINLFISLPALAFTLRFISLRNRDAGYRPGIAYLGAIPLVQFFFIIWLLFAKPALQAETSNAA